MKTCCPGPSELARIGRGADAGSCPPDLAAHIEDCPECRQFLERCAAEGPDSISLRAGRARSDGALPRIDGFTIARELGRGAMGVVYLADREMPRRRVALKLVPGGRLAGPQEWRRWLREAEATAAVRHPHVVTLYEAIVTDDWFVLALEYVPGGTLADRLVGPLAPRTAARIVEALAGALHHIHRSGLLHLDLKPSNILLDGDADVGWERLVPKVTDFGIARAAEPAATDTGGAGPGGTPSYMAPEQITRPRKDMTAQADIHGLGAILYHLLTGRPPYHGTTVLETIDQLLRQEPVPPRRLVAQIPRDLETIALKCLEKHPARRCASAEVLADDLRRWLDGRPIAARPVASPEKLWRACRRRPAVATLASILALVLSTAFLTVLALWWQAEAERRRAEDERRFAGRLLGEICVDGELGSAQLVVLPRDDVIAVLQRTRGHIVRLRTERPGDSAASQQLAQLDVTLATHLVLQGKTDECRSALVECLENLDRVLRIHPRDQAALLCRFHAYRALGSVIEKEGKTEEGLVHLRTAVAQGQECVSLRPDADLINQLAHCRWSLAEALSRRGDPDGARSLIRANLRMLNEVPGDEDDPVITIWRTLARLDLHQFRAASSSAPASRPDAGDPLARLAAPGADALDAESWAELVVQCLSPVAGAGDLPDKQLCSFVDCLSARVTWQRRSGRIDEARRSAGRMHAFARLLAARHPGRSAARFALCQSYKQMAKNAWEPVADRAAIERNWRLAIDEGRQALRLDPRNARAGSEVADLQNRLDGFLASGPEPPGPDRANRAAGEAG